MRQVHHGDQPHRSPEYLKRIVLITIFLLSWTSNSVAWGLMEWFGRSSVVLRVVFGLNAVFHPVMALIVWRRLLPLSVVDLTCLYFAFLVCGACMALRFYVPAGANIDIYALYVWIPVIYVFAFTIPDQRRSLRLSLANLGLYVAISVPYLLQNMTRAEAAVTIQLHLVSGVLIAALYFFSSYAQRFRVAQLTAEEFARLANTDDLTQLANRRRARETIDYELARSARYAPFSVIVFDIDHFKTVNDRFGHSVGDETLAALAARTREVLREVDTLGRWGGEEFIAILPETGFEVTIRKANELCRHVAATPLVGEHRVTISAGVATSTHGDSAESLLRRADSALYAAKEGGRNRAEAFAATGVA